MQEFTDTFKEFLERMNIQRREEEKRIFEEAARQEEEKRISKEKEAAKLEAKCKIQECLNIEEKSIPQASTHSRKFRIDPTISNFTISTKCILLSDFEIPPVTPNVETVNSLSMGDKHLDTSKDSLESSVKDPVPIPSESNDTSNGAWNSLLNDGKFQTTLNDCDDESLSDEDIPKENFKIYSIPLFDDEEIISTKIDPHSFNTESNFIESLLNRDILIDSSPKFDYLLEEFSGELAHIDPIPPGIEKADFDLEEEIRLVKNLLYDNSSPRPPEELNLEIADMIFESLSPSPILVEDSDSLMEEIDLFLASDDSMPPGIKDDDYDSEGDIRFLEELLNNDSPPLPENESFSLDHFDDPSLPRPPPEPPDVEICLGDFINKVVGDISEHDVLMPNLLPTQPTLCPVFDLLLLFSSENEDKLFKPGISFFFSYILISSGQKSLLNFLKA
ncbi:hypothetical protein Tco_0536931 [Tanacetum coccineum]